MGSCLLSVVSLIWALSTVTLDITLFYLQLRIQLDKSACIDAFECRRYLCVSPIILYDLSFATSEVWFEGWVTAFKVRLAHLVFTNRYLKTKQCIHSAAPPGFRFGGGDILGGRPSRGSGGAEPPDAGEFSKICKRFLKKMQKIHYFGIFFEKFNKPCINFSRVWTKTLWKCWKFLMKIQLKNWIFIYFWEKLLLKIELSGITSFFYNNFFRFMGGWTPLRTPLYGPTYQYHENFNYRLMSLVAFIMIHLRDSAYLGTTRTKLDRVVVL